MTKSWYSTASERPLAMERASGFTGVIIDDSPVGSGRKYQPDSRKATMTNGVMNLRAIVEETPNVDALREMIGIVIVKDEAVPWGGCFPDATATAVGIATHQIREPC